MLKYLPLLCLLLPGARALSQVPCTLEKEQEIKVMSYNMRLDVASDKENAWPKRKEFLASQILYHAPDVLGTQEGLPQQVAWLKEHLTPYTMVGEGREGGDQGEYSALFYNRHRFKAEKSGTFWLSTTPGEVSKGWDAALPRICTWAKLSERDGGQAFFVFNTHFDHVGEQARAESATLILSMMDSLNKEGLPNVFMGDLNLTPETRPIKLFNEQLLDAFGAASTRLGPAGTFNGFSHSDPATRRIDYIMVSPGVEVAKFATLTDAIEGRYASDHFPVVATLHPRPRPAIIAHRGASGYALENSLPAFQKAVDLGSDMTELDVFKLRDGNIVVFHDGGLKRLTDSEAKIEDLDLDELNKVVLGGMYKIPRLEDVLMLVDKRMRINVELKGPDTAEGTYRIIQDFIKHHGWKIEDFHISSFRHDELKRMRELNEEIDIAILPHGAPLQALDVAREVNAVAINAYVGSLDSAVVKQIHDAGFRVNAWTVNSRADIRRMLSIGIDGYITNYPDRVREESEWFYRKE